MIAEVYAMTKLEVSWNVLMLEIDVDETNVEITERVLLDGTNIEMILGKVITQHCHGGVDGTLILEVNTFENMKTGEITSWGRWTWEVMGGSQLDLTGVAQGHFSAIYLEGLLVSYNLYGRGFEGDLNGWIIRCWSKSNYLDLVIEYEAVLLFPSNFLDIIITYLFV